MPEGKTEKNRKTHRESLTAKKKIGKAAILAAERLKNARIRFKSSDDDLDVRHKSRIEQDEMRDLGIPYRPDSEE